MVININKLNLEEQEKLAAVGYFWRKWGTLLAALITVVLLAVAAWYGYGWYQDRQSFKAGTLYEQIMADAQTGDTTKLAASLKAMQDDYASTVQAQLSNLLAARIFYEKGQIEQSRSALTAATTSKADHGLQSTAKLQLAGLMVEQKQYDEAIKQLSSNIDPSYMALATDRLGDVYALQGKRSQAIEAYTRAFQMLDAEQPYRQMVAAKLSGFGIDAAALLKTSSASVILPSSAAASTAQAAISQ